MMRSRSTVVSESVGRVEELRLEHKSGVELLLPNATVELSPAPLSSGSAHTAKLTAACTVREIFSNCVRATEVKP